MTFCQMESESNSSDLEIEKKTLIRVELSRLDTGHIWDIWLRGSTKETYHICTLPVHFSLNGSRNITK